MLAARCTRIGRIETTGASHTSMYFFSMPKLQGYDNSLTRAWSDCSRCGKAPGRRGGRPGADYMALGHKPTDRRKQETSARLDKRA